MWHPKSSSSGPQTDHVHDLFGGPRYGLCFDIYPLWFGGGVSITSINRETNIDEIIEEVLG